MNMINLLTSSLSSQEAITFALSQQSIIDIIRDTWHTFVLPFYYLFMHIWTRLFGTSEYILRLPSFIFHSLTVLIAHIYFEDRYGKTGTRLWAATLAIFFFPLFLYFAFQATPHSFIFFLVILCLYFFHRFQRKDLEKNQTYFFWIALIALSPWGIMLFLTKKVDFRTVFAESRGISVCRKQIQMLDSSQIPLARYYNREVPVSVFTVAPVYPEKACVIDSSGVVEIRSHQ